VLSLAYFIEAIVCIFEIMPSAIACPFRLLMEFAAYRQIDYHETAV
jgi:hypothetical protein